MPKHYVFLLVYVAMSSIVSNSFAAENFHKPQTAPEQALFNIINKYQTERKNAYEEFENIELRSIINHLDENGQKAEMAKLAKLYEPLNVCTQNLYYTSKVVNDRSYYKKIKPNPEQLKECRKYFSEYFLKKVADQEFKDCNDTMAEYICTTDLMTCRGNTVPREVVLPHRIGYKTVKESDIVVIESFVVDNEGYPDDYYECRKNRKHDDPQYHMFKEDGIWKIYDVNCEG